MSLLRSELGETLERILVRETVLVSAREVFVERSERELFITVILDQ